MTKGDRVTKNNQVDRTHVMSEQEEQADVSSTPAAQIKRTQPYLRIQHDWQVSVHEAHNKNQEKAEKFWISQTTHGTTNSIYDDCEVRQISPQQFQFSIASNPSLFKILQCSVVGRVSTFLHERYLFF